MTNALGVMLVLSGSLSLINRPSKVQNNWMGAISTVSCDVASLAVMALGVAINQGWYK